MEKETINDQFIKAKRSDDYGKHMIFIENLLSFDHPDILNIHFNLLKDTENIQLYQLISDAFIERGKQGEQFLINQIDNEKDIRLKGDILKILGEMDSKLVLPYTERYMKSEKFELRYSSIIVLGWIGGTEHIDLLGKQLFDDTDPLLRGYSATAQRQIWYRLPETKEKILFYLKKALESEQDSQALTLIIITAQSIMKKKFGIKETADGINEPTISVKNIEKAKEKTLKALMNEDKKL